VPCSRIVECRFPEPLQPVFKQGLGNSAAASCARSPPVYSASKSPSARSSKRMVPSMHAASTQFWSRLTASRRANGGVSCSSAAGPAHVSGLRHRAQGAGKLCSRSWGPPAPTFDAGHRVVQVVGEQPPHAHVKAAHGAVHAASQNLAAASARDAEDAVPRANSLCRPAMRGSLSPKQACPSGGSPGTDMQQ
jgi:hypothetical protein